VYTAFPDRACDIVRVTVHGKAATEGQPITAVGVALEPGAYPVENVNIVQCLFVGPLAAGVRCDATTSTIEISRNRFHECTEGILFEGKVNGKTHNLVKVLNNTFYKGNSGLVFGHMPELPKDKLVVRNNLFLEQAQAEGVCKQGFKAAEFERDYKGQISHNYSTGPSGGNAQPGVITRLDGGQIAEAAKLPKDPADVANYLKPPGGDLFKNLGVDVDVRDPGAPNPNARIKYVGAMPP
jgi:hypothetical protein